jgi:hypothetical protein
LPLAFLSLFTASLALLPWALRTRMDETGLRLISPNLNFRRDDDAVEVIRLAIKLKGRTDVKSKVRCRLL